MQKLQIIEIEYLLELKAQTICSNFFVGVFFLYSFQYLLCIANETFSSIKSKCIKFWSFINVRALATDLEKLSGLINIEDLVIALHYGWTLAK
jgi:hypothetical protein